MRSSNAISTGLVDCGETHSNQNQELYVSTSFATISISCENRVVYVSTHRHVFFSCIPCYYSILYYFVLP